MEGQKAVICFFSLFMTVYFLEAIGGFYMTSAVVAIEKQFQIPSRMSGLMVSAGDFGYIPSVVFVSYLGGKGNRARWIGGGCLMIALSNFLISMSNFLFPVENVQLNTSIVGHQIEQETGRLSDATIVNSFMQYMSKYNLEHGITELIDLPARPFNNMTLREYATDNLGFCYPKNETENICNRYFDYLHEVNAPNATEIANIRVLIGAPFAMCSSLVNGLRDQIEIMKCSRNPSNLGPFILIFGGLLILGVGRTMPFSLGLPLVDDNVKRKNLPIYFAGMFFIRILGPVLGFVIGGVTNKYYYAFETPPGLSPRDPMWIGRWWAGFLGISIVLAGPSLALYFFPDPSKKKRKNQTEEQKDKDAGKGVNLETDNGVELEALNPAKPTHKRNRSLALVDRHVTRDSDGNAVVPKNFDEKVKDFVSTVKTIVKAPVYTGAIIGRILDVLAFKGFWIFLPKYLQVQFGIPQHTINFYMGIVGVSGFACGVIIGCIIMRKFRLQGRKAAAFVAVCSTAAAILSFLNSTVGCKSVLSSLADSPLAINATIESSCSPHCSCEGMPLYPVCNRLGQPFYSPCQAGCPLDQSLANDDPNKLFKNCECAGTPDMLVSRDYCDESSCQSKFTVYFINMAISGVFGGMGVVPAVLILLRSVPPLDRSVSLGFQGFLVSLFATLPSPVIWGWIVDSTCIRWNDVCGDPTRGACAIYDTDLLRLRTHITYGVMRMVSLVSDIWVFIFAKNLIITDEEPTPEDHEENIHELTTDCMVDTDRKFSM